MSCFALITTTIFLYFFYTISLSVDANNNTEIIKQVCKASRNHSTCQASLFNTPHHIPPNPTVLQAIEAALSVSWHNLNTSMTMVQNIIDASSQNTKTHDDAERCLVALGHSLHRTGQSSAAFASRPNDARAWLSAVLAQEYGCFSDLEKMNDTATAQETVNFFNSTLIVSTTNALLMVANYDDHGDDTGSWAPTKTERDEYWPNRKRPVSMPPFGVPSGLTPNVTVCKTGCDYPMVQKAVQAAPNNSDSLFVIWIKAGIYEETVLVPFETRNVVFLGAGMGKTVITGNRNVGLQGLKTFNTSTVSALGDGFMAHGITVQNTAGPGANQAVAFRSESDLSVFENCEFLGNQDTLYANALRQYYKSCRIQGNVDFVFGGAMAYFENCSIVITPRQDGPEKDNTVTAHARKDPAQSTGFVFRKCSVDGNEAYLRLYNKNVDPSVFRNYLGRPWKEYSRTVFVKCRLGGIISPQGWTIWDGGFGLETLYYGEYGNTGDGSKTSRRANFSSIIPRKHVKSYSIRNFFG